MKSTERRLAALESRAGINRETIDIIFVTSVAPGADGPVHLGPALAYILTGPYAGTQQRRDEVETGDAFAARCNAMVENGL